MAHFVVKGHVGDICGIFDTEEYAETLAKRSANILKGSGTFKCNPHFVIEKWENTGMISKTHVYAD